MRIQATGAAGGSGGHNGSVVGGAGGLGDGVSGGLSGLNGGTQTLDVCVDQGGGLGGPGTGSSAALGGGDGGGASGVSLGSDFSMPVLVAGAGGGGGSGVDEGVGGFAGDGGVGGSAGMPVAGTGGPSVVAGFGGGGGGDNTALTGGAGGFTPNHACAGTAGAVSGSTGPGAGGVGITAVCFVGGGGGGAGYLGGGGAASFGAPAAGGGGGTDFCADSVSDCTVSSGAGTQPSAGSDAGDAQVTISFESPDLTGPVDAPVVSPAANANGWNDSDVSVGWNWADSDSGVDPAQCTQSSASSGEGAQTLAATCADLAGNSSSDSVQVKVDKTKPVDNPVVSTTASGASVAWNWSDALSGVDPTKCTQSSSQSGTGQLTLTSSCTDVAGNTATDSKTVTVAAPVNKADVQVKVYGPATGSRNTVYSYTVTTKDAGPGAAKNVVSTLLLPAGATFVSDTGSPLRWGPLLTWTAPNLASGSKVSYTVKVRFPAPCRGAKSQTWALLAVAASLPTGTTSATPDPNLRNNLAAVLTKIR